MVRADGPLTLLQFLLRNLSQLVHVRRLARDRAFGNLELSRDKVAFGNRIRRRLRGDLDDADTRILGPTVMLAVAKIAQPCLERRAVIFPDHVPVGDDVRCAADGGPLSLAVEEGHVDLGVALQVVGLAGFGICVEEEIEAATFLDVKIQNVSYRVGPKERQGNARGGTRTFAATAIHLDTSSPLLSILVVIMPNLHVSMKLTRSSTFSLSSGSFLFSAL